MGAFWGPQIDNAVSVATAAAAVYGAYETYQTAHEDSPELPEIEEPAPDADLTALEDALTAEMEADEEARRRAATAGQMGTKAAGSLNAPASTTYKSLLGE